MDFLKKVTESVAPKTDATAKSAPPTENQSSLFSSANILAGSARSAFQHEQPQHDNAEVAAAGAELLAAAQTYGKLDKTSGLGSCVDKAQSYLEEYESSHTAKPTTEAPQECKPDESATKPTTTEESAPKPSSEAPPTDSVKPPSGGVHKPSSEEPKQEEEEPPVKEKTKPSSEDVPSHEKEPKHQPSTEETEPPTESAKPGADDEPKCGGKEEVNKEPETEPASENIPSGVGDYAKIAKGFLKKNSAEEDQGPQTGDSDQSGGLGGIAKLAGGFFK